MDVQWNPLNGINLGQTEIQSNNQMMLISELDSTYNGYENVA
jgi:hypothetical protein